LEKIITKKKKKKHVGKQYSNPQCLIITITITIFFNLTFQIKSMVVFQNLLIILLIILIIIKKIILILKLIIIIKIIIFVTQIILFLILIL
jgi:hypothetical protein